ncbi:SPL family radical SAM protein [Perspicuibacillus lycopersici]
MNISYKLPKRILTPTGGFLKEYTHSLNPYVGCSFACSYCYVRQSPIGLFRNQEWGTWVDVKQEVKEKIKTEIHNFKKRGKEVTIFMSSSTDPYQPIEYQEKITRSLLEGMVATPPDFLFIQTRSPIITRDIDLLVQLKDRLRISMTVETDNESVRKRFSPKTPPIAARLKAIRKLREHHLPVQVAIAPILPFSERFPETISQLVNRIVVDDFFTGDGSNGKRTERLNIKSLYEEDQLANWYGENAHLFAIEQLKNSFSPEQIFISKEGFLPF